MPVLVSVTALGHALLISQHCIQSVPSCQAHALCVLQKGKPQGPCPQFVQEVQTPLNQALQYDVIMCGGTLGIFLACCLQLKGLR